MNSHASLKPLRPQPSAIRATSDYESLPTRKSLLSRLRDADDDASWQTFFETYWQLIYIVARKSGLSDDAAQEVVQETVISVARRLPEFRYDPKTGSFKQWLLLITRRRIHDYLRRGYRSLPPANEPADETSGRTEQIAAPTLAPDEQIDASWEEEWRERIFQMALSRVRARVKPKHFQVFDYCVLRNMRAPEVARMLGLNTAQVYLARHRVSLAVKRTAAQVERELNEDRGTLRPV